jgi:hypothetical protein
LFDLLIEAAGGMRSAEGEVFFGTVSSMLMDDGLVVLFDLLIEVVGGMKAAEGEVFFLTVFSMFV